MNIGRCILLKLPLQLCCAGTGCLQLSLQLAAAFQLLQAKPLRLLRTKPLLLRCLAELALPLPTLSLDPLCSDLSLHQSVFLFQTLELQEVTVLHLRIHGVRLLGLNALALSLKRRSPGCIFGLLKGTNFFLGFPSGLGSSCFFLLTSLLCSSLYGLQSILSQLRRPGTLLLHVCLGFLLQPFLLLVVLIQLLVQQLVQRSVVLRPTT